MKKQFLLMLLCTALLLAACGNSKEKRASSNTQEDMGTAFTTISAEPVNDMESLETKYQAGTLDFAEYDLFAEQLAAAGRFETQRDVLERAQLLSYSEDRQQILNGIIITLTPQDTDVEGSAEAAVNAVYELLKSGEAGDINNLIGIEAAISLLKSDEWKNEFMQKLPVGKRSFEYHVSDTSVLKLTYEMTLMGEQSTKLCLEDAETGYIAVSITDKDAVICRAEAKQNEMLSGAFIYERRTVDLVVQSPDDVGGGSETMQPVEEMLLEVRHQGRIEEGHFTGAYICTKTGRSYQGEFDEEGRTRVQQKEEIQKESKVVYADVTEGTSYFYLALVQAEDFVFTPEALGIEVIELW